MTKGKGKTVVLLDHPGGKRDDRASRMLAERGYRLEWCCAGQGDALPEIRDDHAGAVVYGGPESVNGLEEYSYLRAEIAWIERWLKADKPYFGICLGGQLLARALGARVAPHPEDQHEIGYVRIEPTAEGGAFLPRPLHVYHWHNEGFEVPAGAVRLAAGPVFANQAYQAGEGVYGIQFHPEVTVPVMTRWMSEAAHKLSRPGAQPAERQLADARLHDEPLRQWLDRFLEGWPEPRAKAAEKTAAE